MQYTSLVGSYAKGDHLKSSDIDMPVISENFREIPFMERLDIVNRIVWKKNLGNVEILPLTSEEVSKGSSVVVRDAKKYWLRVI